LIAFLEFIKIYPILSKSPKKLQDSPFLCLKLPNFFEDPQSCLHSSGVKGGRHIEGDWDQGDWNQGDWNQGDWDAVQKLSPESAEGY